MHYYLHYLALAVLLFIQNENTLAKKDFHPLRSCLSAGKPFLISEFCLYISCHILLIKKCFDIICGALFGKKEDGRCCGSASSSGALTFSDFMNNHSDSPVSQYRNKNTMLLFTCLINDIGVQRWQWIFAEPGHGKGAPRSCQRSNKALVQSPPVNLLLCKCKVYQKSNYTCPDIENLK